MSLFIIIIGVSTANGDLYITSASLEDFDPVSPVEGALGRDVPREEEVEHEDRLVDLLIASNDSNQSFLPVKDEFLSCHVLSITD